MQNPNILWDRVAANLASAETQAEVDGIWQAMDRYCWGREDVERLDRLVKEATERLRGLGIPA